MSAASNFAPASSKGVAGTQEGIANRMLSFVPFAASIM